METLIRVKKHQSLYIQQETRHFWWRRTVARMSGRGVDDRVRTRCMPVRGYGMMQYGARGVDLQPFGRDIDRVVLLSR